MDELRFAGDEADLAALVEAELIRALQLEMLQEFILGKERERMREVMRLRTDKLAGGSPARLMEAGWLGDAEGWA
jgi:hypothetical protein